jgi:hypothetical protein
MTVAYRHQDGSWINLTDYVDPESGSTTIGVGELSRSLTNAGTEPVGPRPIPDATIPGVVSWDLPFTTGVYLDGLGNTRARILVNWLLPLNSDGSTILDGSHYEIRYGVSPASEWQVAFAPWGDLQAQIIDLSPGVDYDFQIRAVDLSGNQGAWSATETATANPDTIAPSTPAPPTVAGSRIAVQITHQLGKASGGTFNLELDLDHLEIHVGDSSGFTPDSTTLKGKVSAHAGMIAAQIPAIATVQVEETTTRHVKVIAVDQAGNRSSASTAATATALLIDSAHISDLTASKITAGTLSADVIVGARIKTADTGARAELNTSGLQMYNGSNTLLVSLQSNGVFFMRSATSGARLDLSNVTGIQLYNSGGTRTVWLNLDGSFELRSAASGARIQLDGNGFSAFNSSGQQTVDIDSGTGDVTLVGKIATAFTGRRIIFNHTGPNDPKITFLAPDNTNSAFIAATSIHNDVSDISMQSSVSDDPGYDRWAEFVLSNSGSSLRQWGNGAGGDSKAQIDVNELQIRLVWNGSSAHTLSCNDTGWRVNGTAIKSFIIDHPVHADRYLVHACTESPNAGVEYWGDTELDELGQAVVALPDYFEALTLKTGRAVAVNTCTDEIRNASASYPEDGQFRIYGAPGVRVTWIVKAIRADSREMIVEPRRDAIDVRGDGPYRYYTLKEPRG